MASEGFWSILLKSQRTMFGKLALSSQIKINKPSLLSALLSMLFAFCVSLTLLELVKCIWSLSHIKQTCVECFENDEMIDFTICSQSLWAPAPAQQVERKSLTHFPISFIPVGGWCVLSCLLIFIHCRSPCCCTLEDCLPSVFPTCPLYLM